MNQKRKIALILLGFSLVLFAAGCKKKVPPPAPPPPPPPVVEKTAPARPTANLKAEPTSIDRGKSATLKWNSSNATSAELNQGIGAVSTSGSREVFPTETTEYVLTVKGDGGPATARATVTVRTPPPPAPPPPPTESVSELLGNLVKDAYFDYDKSDIRPDAEATLRANAAALKELFSEFPDGRLVIEGHCDERGTNEYNLALGDRRSTTARDFLVNLGVPASRMTTISYGEERPQCSEEAESCWQRNRRAHFAAAQ
jgi:peptidoglycan-associated lipoprotein